MNVEVASSRLSLEWEAQYQLILCAEIPHATNQVEKNELVRALCRSLAQYAANARAGGR